MICVTMFADLEPIIVQSITAVLAVAVPLITQWMRSRTRRLVVEEAATEAEAAGYRDGLSGTEKKLLAVTLSNARLGMFTSMSEDDIASMVERALPHARVSARPPPDA